MKALISVKVKRNKEVREWVSAAEQSTDAGRNEFWARQQERMRLAQERHVVVPHEEAMKELARWIELRWRLSRCKSPQERTFVRRSVGARYANRKRA